METEVIYKMKSTIIFKYFMSGAEIRLCFIEHILFFQKKYYWKKFVLYIFLRSLASDHQILVIIVSDLFYVKYLYFRAYNAFNLSTGNNIR